MRVCRLPQARAVRWMATSAGTPPPPSPPSCPAPSSPGSRELVAGLAPLLQYCQAHSSPPHPALRDLQVLLAPGNHLYVHQEFTMARGNSRMLAAPEVLALNSLLIKVSSMHPAHTCHHPTITCHHLSSPDHQPTTRCRGRGWCWTWVCSPGPPPWRRRWPWGRAAGWRPWRGAGATGRWPGGR